MIIWAVSVKTRNVSEGWVERLVWTWLKSVESVLWLVVRFGTGDHFTAVVAPVTDWDPGTGDELKSVEAIIS